MSTRKGGSVCSERGKEEEKREQNSDPPGVYSKDTGS